MEVIKLNKKNQQKTIGLATDYIKAGKIIIFPTDTVYGILCDAKNKKAVNRVFKIKKRLKQKFFPVFVKDIKTAKNIAKINKKEESFLKKCWPGKTTVVLEKKTFKIYGVDKKKIALRVPNYKPLNLLLKKMNAPLIQTSANIAGKKPKKDPKEIIKDFKERKLRPDLIIDDGVLENKPSTLINLTTSPYKILRN
ncbi:MAG: L-threonylcarbamoyladenylate synthase [Candidatus Pacebacteria bacterium]|nr:L-threonylcarbamoyladenylate synthase [Candidatus Paceibacterota bacterium]